MSFFKAFAILNRTLSSTSPEIATAKTGNLDKFTSITLGSSVSLGNLLFIRSILTLVSDRAFSELKPASNSNKTLPPL